MDTIMLHDHVFLQSEVEKVEVFFLVENYHRPLGVYQKPK